MEPRSNLIIDISHHQGVAWAHRWPEVASKGVGGVLLKHSEGASYLDPEYAEAESLASMAGLPVGPYHVTRPWNCEGRASGPAGRLLTVDALRRRGPRLRLAVDWEHSHIERAIAYFGGHQAPESKGAIDDLSPSQLDAGRQGLAEYSRRLRRALRAATGSAPLYYISARGLSELGPHANAFLGARGCYLWWVDYVDSTTARARALALAAGEPAPEWEMLGGFERFHGRVALVQFTSSLRADDWGIGREGGSGSLDGNMVVDWAKIEAAGRTLDGRTWDEYPVLGRTVTTQR